ncbi:MAG: SLBB domain-containing protein [Candidatus Ratteibacteria bacterium]
MKVEDFYRAIKINSLNLLKKVIFNFFICFFSFTLYCEVFSGYPELKIFGEDFFENYTPFLKTHLFALNEDYIIGPGDTIIISVWGFFEQEYQKEVEIDGSIFISGIGKIYIAGKTIKEVRKIVEDKFYKKYKNIQVSVSGGKIRTINIYILGEVKKPGAYEIFPFLNIVDIIALAGGPSKNGSLRNIEIIKYDGKKELLDIYPVLLKGEKPKIMQFQPGDTIFVHQSENLVGITGGVRKPAIYELKNMNLKELIDLSGGFLPIADISHIQIERIDKEKGKVLIDLNEKEIDNFSLKNFDVVKVPLLNLESFYQVSITGAVKTERVYGWKEGIKICSLFSISKIFVYGIIGGLSSFFGNYIQKIIQKEIFSYISGFILTFTGVWFLFPEKRYIKILKVSTPILLGVIEGIIPCAPLIGLIFYIAFLNKGILFGLNAGFLFGIGSIIFPVFFICGFIPYLWQKFLFYTKVKIIFKFLGFSIFAFWGINLIFHRF